MRILGISAFYHDSAAAVHALRSHSHPVDLVLSDFNMPGLSGLDVAREAAAVRPELPVVISSGYIDDVLVTEARRMGVRALLHIIPGHTEYHLALHAERYTGSENWPR